MPPLPDAFGNQQVVQDLNSRTGRENAYSNDNYMNAPEVFNMVADQPAVAPPARQPLPPIYRAKERSQYGGNNEVPRQNLLGTQRPLPVPGSPAAAEYVSPNKLAGSGTITRHTYETDYDNYVYSKTGAALDKYELNPGVVITWMTHYHAHHSKNYGTPMEGKGYYRNPGTPLDTGELFAQKSSRATEGKKYEVSHAKFEGAMDESLGKEWKSACIWVISRSGKLYTNVAKADQFHHTTFTSGGPVLGAGEWIVRKGLLAKLCFNSGHYRPNPALMMQSLNWFKTNNALRNETLLTLYNKTTKRYVEIEYGTFIDPAKTPNWSATYTTHAYSR